jgi:hypothetical protein
MTERTLSILLISSTLIALLGCFLMPAGPHFAEVPRFIRIGYMVVFGAVPILLMMKLISKLFPLGFKGERLSLNEGMFTICYVFLTKEAREEWRRYISEQKNKGAA